MPTILKRNIQKPESIFGSSTEVMHRRDLKHNCRPDHYGILSSATYVDKSSPRTGP